MKALLVLAAHFSATPFAPAPAGTAKFYWPFAVDSKPWLGFVGGLPTSGGVLTVLLAGVATLGFIASLLALFGWLIPAIVTISGHPCNDASRGGVIAGIFNVKGTLYTLALAVNSILVVNAGISETSELPLWGDRKCIVLCQHETRKGK